MEQEEVETKIPPTREKSLNIAVFVISIIIQMVGLLIVVAVLGP